MQNITDPDRGPYLRIRLETELLQQIDYTVQSGQAGNRTELVRAAIREHLNGASERRELLKTLRWLSFALIAPQVENWPDSHKKNVVQAAVRMGADNILSPLELCTAIGALNPEKWIDGEGA
ncbi:MAG: ribbon-helix-helix domain-containing protein [Glycocaulis sp.]